MFSSGCNAVVTLFLGLPFAPLAAAPQRAALGPVEAQIAGDVRHELLMLPYYGVFDYLQFRVEGRDVTLMGQVTSPVLKQDAESAVRSIEGVETVTNDIEVLPVSPFDDQIRLAAYKAIYGNPALQRYALPPNPPIRIIVNNGHVTLEGIVDSEMDKTLAGAQARGLPNVFSVTNDLRVEQ